MVQKHTFSLLSFIRNNRKNLDGDSAVYLRITIDGKRSEISTKTYVHSLKWNSARGRVKGTSEESRANNKSIESFELRARAVYSSLMEKGKVITAEIIKNAVIGFEEKQRTLSALFTEVYEDMKSKTNNGFAPGTIKNWKVTKLHLAEFISKQYHLSDVALKELNYKFIVDFESYAKTHWGCRINAAIKHIERIRKVVNLAVANNWIDKDPFLSYKAKKEKTKVTFLSAEELDSIEQKDLLSNRLERVRDIFIFSCYTGLAYSDIEKLTPDNIVLGIDGQKWVYTFRTKTDTKSNVPLLPQALSILEKYKSNSAISNKNKLLPVITNIKTNEYLKEIATRCGIIKNLTFHMARHTFATTIALTNGVPIETVSNILGHTSLRTTQIYAKVIETKVSSDMQALKKTLAKKKFKSCNFQIKSRLSLYGFDSTVTSKYLNSIWLI